MEFSKEDIESVARGRWGRRYFKRLLVVLGLLVVLALCLGLVALEWVVIGLGFVGVGVIVCFLTWWVRGSDRESKALLKKWDDECAKAVMAKGGGGCQRLA